VPVPGKENASAFFVHGFLVYDDGETLLKILRHKPGRNPFSLNVRDFESYILASFASADLQIASADLFAMVSAPAPMVEVAPRERETLLRQIGILTLLPSERAGIYRRGGKRNARRIGDAFAEMAAVLPSADTFGLSAPNIRKNVSEDLALLGQGRTG
jgi:hypothetical protein